VTHILQHEETFLSSHPYADQVRHL